MMSPLKTLKSMSWVICATSAEAICATRPRAASTKNHSGSAIRQMLKWSDDQAGHFILQPVSATGRRHVGALDDLVDDEQILGRRPRFSDGMADIKRRA